MISAGAGRRRCRQDQTADLLARVRSVPGTVGPEGRSLPAAAAAAGPAAAGPALARQRSRAARRPLGPASPETA